MIKVFKISLVLFGSQKNKYLHLYGAWD